MEKQQQSTQLETSETEVCVTREEEAPLEVVRVEPIPAASAEALCEYTAMQEAVPSKTDAAATANDLSTSGNLPPPSSPLNLANAEGRTKDGLSAMGRALERLANPSKVFKSSPSVDFPPRHDVETVESHFALAADRTRAVSSGLIGLAAGAKAKGAVALAPANAVEINTADELLAAKAQKIG